MERVPFSRGETFHEFTFSDHDFQMISDLANARYGLFLQPSKKALVHSRLAKRLRALKLASFEDYCSLLNKTEGDAERPHLLSALTTNVTHFFREMHHFDFLKDVLVPQLIEKSEAGNPVRLWSSACSSGQEAYSIAAALIAAAPKLSQHDIKILATDIDPQVVQTAKRAVYPTEQIETLPPFWRDLLTGSKKPQSGDFSIDPALQNLISFGELNLIADWPMKGKFDVILCRNAAIYFDKATQARLWGRFADVLVEGGHLMIGHSERLSGPAQSAFKSVGITTYQKLTVASAPLKTTDEGDKN
ncbi:chemotaxis protein [Loktanella sp. 5RATIMAR09]|nr:chemotaxis protein [Loktanella sp. 5RATIMAR09]